MQNKGKHGTRLWRWELDDNSKASLQNNRCKSNLTAAKRSSKGQSMEHGCDVEKLKIQSSCEAILCAEESRSRSNLMIKACWKALKFYWKYWKFEPGGNPEAKIWKLQPRWPKMLPRVVLERVWRPLGGALGRPREALEKPKSMLGGGVFEVEKALV